MILESHKCGWSLAQVVTIANGAGDEVDATTSGYTHVFPAGSDMFPAGTTFHPIAEDCETPDPPAGTVQVTAYTTNGRRHTDYLQL